MGSVGQALSASARSGNGPTGFRQRKCLLGVRTFRGSCRAASTIPSGREPCTLDRHLTTGTSSYIEPGRPRDAGETITQLIAVLDNQDLARAIDRLEIGSRVAAGEGKRPLGSSTRRTI